MMRTSFNTIAGAVCGAGLLASSALAQEGKQHTLSEFQLGETIVGDDIKLDKLDGKVVVIEYWGTR